MARSLSPTTVNVIRATLDDTLPMTCTIESSQLVEGHGVRFSSRENFQ